MENKNDGGDDFSNSVSSGGNDLGGLIRGFVRGLVRKFVATANLGSIPHPNTIAKSSGKLSDIIDFSEHLKSANEENRQKFGESKFKWFYGTVVTAAPSFIKSSITGTVLFSIYDETLKTKLLNQNSFSPLVAGSCAGFSHGCVSIAWDWLQKQWTLRVRGQNSFASGAATSLHGALCLHTISHASLFSVYEATKSVLLEQSSNISTRSPPTLFTATKSNRSALLDTSDTSNERRIAINDANDTFRDLNILVDTVCFAVAGATAGVFCEVLDHYLAPLEEEGLKRGLEIGLRQARPSMRSLAFAAVPSSLGFVAYEFGKPTLEGDS